MRSNAFAVFAMIIVTALCVPTVSHANLLTNGSFEVGPAIPGGSSFLTLSGGSTAITGWSVTGSTIDYVGPGWDVSDGVRMIDLDGAFSTGGIEQTITTIPGETYVVSFDLSGNPGGAPQVKQVRVSVDGFQQEFSHDTTGQTPSNLNWQTPRFNFTASGTSATLSFESLSPAGGSFGALIDKVNVDLLEPAACNIELSQDVYFDGDVFTADVFGLANPTLGAEPAAVEWKVWLEPPSQPPLSFLNIGSDGTLVLPGGLDVDLGPVSFFTVISGMDRGFYSLNCRLIDPTTGEQKALDINVFEVQ